MNVDIPANNCPGVLVGLARKVRPFVKWAGGKGQLLPTLQCYVPPFFQRYYEPFVGGGAMFFFLQPEQPFISDLNGELINAYQVVQNGVEELIQSLQEHRNEEDYFYQVRGWDPSDVDPAQRASRFIFLNKTCYNGLYRVNQKGEFNVPFGKYQNPAICDEERLREASAALGAAEIAEADFAVAVAEAGENDFVYLDPPYVPLSGTSSFTSYTENGFGPGEQQRLAEVVQELSMRGCRVLLNNSDTPFVRKLYAEFNIGEALVARSINSNGNGRGAVSELVITNYDLETFTVI